MGGGINKAEKTPPKEKMHRLHSAILVRVAIALACRALAGDRNAARAIADIATCSRALRAAVLSALHTLAPVFRASPQTLAAHVAITPRTLDAYANAKCVMCGKPKRDVRAAERPLLVVHPTCVRKEHLAGNFVTVASLKRRRACVGAALVLTARAIGWYECVLNRPRRAFFASSALLRPPPTN